MKQIHLVQVQGPLERDPLAYRVKKLVNDTRYRIGEKLTARAVESLCQLSNWTVTITGDSTEL